MFTPRHIGFSSRSRLSLLTMYMACILKALLLRHDRFLAVSSCLHSIYAGYCKILLGFYSCVDKVHLQLVTILGCLFNIG